MASELVRGLEAVQRCVDVDKDVGTGGIQSVCLCFVDRLADLWIAFEKGQRWKGGIKKGNLHSKTHEVVGWN